MPARPDGPILDAAGVIDAAEEEALDQRLREYSEATGRTIIVATVPSVDGQDIAVYARDLAELWDIGGEETEQGVLLLAAIDDRKLWITTARGVQGTLTDQSTGQIIRQRIVPAFKAGEYGAGLSAGVEGIVERLEMDPVEAAAVDEAEAAAGRSSGDDIDGATIGSAFFWIILIVAFMFLFGGRGRSGRRGRRYGAASAVGEVILWSALSGAMRGGGGSGGFGGGGGGGGFGGFGGGGGGFNGGGAGGSW